MNRLARTKFCAFLLLSNKQSIIISSESPVGAMQGDRKTDKGVVYMDKNRLAAANEKFLAAILKGELKPIVEAAHEIFGAPVDVVDNAGRCICQVPNEFIGEESWDAYINSKSLSLEKHREAQKYYNNNRLPDKNIVYITDENLAGAPYLMGQFYYNGAIAGHFGILIRDRIPDEEDFQIAELFSRILSNIYSVHISERTDKLFHYEYILNVLKDEPIDETHADTGRKINATEKHQFVILVSPINELYTNTTFSHCVCDYLSKTHRDIFPVIHEGNIVILCRGLPNESGEIYFSHVLSEVLNCLKDYKYITGISREFSNIKDMKAYFMQALMTVKIGAKLNPERETHFYDDYTPYQMLYPLSELPTPDIFLHPIVMELQSYDEKHNTEYFKTFREYIMTLKNKKLTASNLNIHLNTLNYRLEKIMDLFDREKINKQDYTHMICSFLYIDLRP